jgi:hypothetical protein
MFRTVSPSMVKNLRLYIQHHTIQVPWMLASQQPQYLYDIYLVLYVQSYTPDDGRRDRPKHVEFCSKIKYIWDIVHLFGFTIEIAHTRSADKSLEDQEGNKLQRPNSNFCKPFKKKKNSEGSPSNQVSAAAVTSASDEKWRPFNCFFSRVGLSPYQPPCILVFFSEFNWFLCSLGVRNYVDRQTLCVCVCVCEWGGERMQLQ